MAEETGNTVQLYIYDLTNGLASILAPSIIGEWTKLLILKLQCTVQTTDIVCEAGYLCSMVPLLSR